MNSVVARILQILAGAPTSQLLFSDEDSDQLIDFAIRSQADVYYSCVWTNTAVKNIFLADDRGIDVDFWSGEFEIVYPSVIVLNFHSHVASLICLSENEIYYLDYYEEMKRDTHDSRTWGMNYFLYRMIESQFKSAIRSMITVDVILNTRQFLGCNPRVGNYNLQLEHMTMYTELIEYQSVEEFYDLLQSRREVIKDRILNNPADSIGGILWNILINIPIDDLSEDRIRNRLKNDPIYYDSYSKTLLKYLDDRYSDLLENIDLIDRSISNYTSD